MADTDPEVSRNPAMTAPADAVNKPAAIQPFRSFPPLLDMRHLPFSRAAHPLLGDGPPRESLGMGRNEDAGRIDGSLGSHHLSSLARDFLCMTCSLS